MHFHDQPSQYSIVLTLEQLMLLECGCELTNDPDEWYARSIHCRQCSITFECRCSGLPVDMARAYDQFGGQIAQRVYGTVNSPWQRVALTRILALCYGHEEPWIFAIRDHHDKSADDKRDRPTMLEELGDLGITAPPYAYLQYWLGVSQLVTQP